MNRFISSNIGLKFLALILAVVTWVYIVFELHKGTMEEMEAFHRILPSANMASKVLSIKLNLTGEPPPGYIVQYEGVVIEPPSCVIVGPQSVLNRLSYVKTQEINVSEYTKTFTKDVSIVSPLRGFSVKDKFVRVSIPIVKKSSE